MHDRASTTEDVYLGRVAELVTALLPHGAAVSASRDRTRYGTTMSLYEDSRDAAVAASRAVQIVAEHAVAVGLPAGRAVNVRARTFAEFDAEAEDARS